MRRPVRGCPANDNLVQELLLRRSDRLAKVLDFAKGFELTFAPTHLQMTGFALAVFKHDVRLVNSTEVLSKSPDFMRLFFDPRIYSLSVPRAIERGGQIDLVEIMGMLAHPRRDSVAAARIITVASRFMSRVVNLNNEWEARTGHSEH